MPADERYRRQAELLVRILPFVAEEKCFALKGGTAITLFIRNLRRLTSTNLPMLGGRVGPGIQQSLNDGGTLIQGELRPDRRQSGQNLKRGFRRLVQHLE